MDDNTRTKEQSASTVTIGSTITNEYANRSMKNYLINDTEIRSLRISAKITTVAFPIAAAAIGFGFDSVREYQLAGIENKDIALSWIWMTAFVAIPFLIIGCIGLWHGRGILEDVTQGSNDS